MSDPDDELLNKLKQAAETPPPPGWRPGVIYSGRMPSEIVTPPMKELSNSDEYEAAVKALGFPLPDGMSLELVEAQYVYHENSWKRTPQVIDGVEQGVGEAFTSPTASWRYRFKVVPKSATEDIDVAALMDEAREAVAGAPLTVKSKHSRVISLSDFQTGKTDILGGTKELIHRSETALSQMVDKILSGPTPAEIILVDPGDSVEGFESAPNARQMNDLDLTTQIRVWRRIFWRWVEALAPLTPSLKVISVPSNHARVRRGKDAQAGLHDDWGIEVLSQLSDIASVNPEAFGHVQFFMPEEFREHILLTLVGGKVLGVEHGHQVNSPDALREHIKKNARNGIGQADIVVVGHFHHLRIIAFGSFQWLFVSPTMDPGSSWYTPKSGEESDPGVLSFSVNEDGWFDLFVAWV